MPIGTLLERYAITLSADTSIYATTDLLTDTQAITDLYRSSRPCILYDLRLVDEDDQGTAVDIYFLRSNTSLGTENAAFAPTDAMSREIVKKIAIAAGDFTDEGLYRVAQKSLSDGIGCVLAPSTDTSIGYVATVCRSGTPTYSASGLRLYIGVARLEAL
jgi:hypothetical protein